MKKFPWACVALTALSLYSGSLFAANFSASFKNTDVREFIDTVGRNLNKTILVDPSVQGTVSVRTYNVLTEEEYYQFFLSVLDLYGLSVIPMDNGMVKVVRSSVARMSGAPIADSKNPGKGDEIITRVVRMENVPVRELAPLLRQLNDASGIGNVVHFEPSNVLLLTGKASVVNRLVDLVQRVDQSGVQRREIVPLRFASAKDLSDMLNNLNNEEQKGQNAPQLATKVVADDETNSLVISGSPDARQRTRMLISQLDREQNNEGNTRVFYLKYANASKVVPVLTGIGEQLKDKAGGGKSKAAPMAGDLNITADESTNSLVITAQPNVMNSLEKVIDKLDIRRPQVLVEAIIAEVQDGNGLDLGVQWTGKHGGVQFGSTGLPISQIKKSKVIGSYTGLATGFFNGDFGALMTALSATIGTGNIAGVATAVVAGGPGAVFWMWMTALFGMATKYAEGVLAVKYRVTNSKGEMSGGPMYYIERGLGKKWLAVLFAIFGVLASFGIGSSVQSNSVAQAIHASFSIDTWITGVVLTVFTGLVILGGIRSISRVSSAIVPIMAVGYVLGGLIVIAMHLDLLFPALQLILTDAFTGEAVAGGALGTVIR